MGGVDRLDMLSRQPEGIEFVGPDDGSRRGQTLFQRFASITEPRGHTDGFRSGQLLDKLLGASPIGWLQQLEIEVKRSGTEVSGPLQSDEFLLVAEFLDIHRDDPVGESPE